MRMATADLITAEAFLRMGEHGRWTELERGVVVPVNPPGHEHGRIQAILAARLLAFVDARALGTVVVESGFTLSRNPDTVRGPDVSFVRRDRVGAAPRHGYVEGAPDLAVEVRSPDDRMPALFEKAGEYLRSGALLVWVVDPESEVVYALRPGQERVALTGADALDGGEVLPGFTLPLVELFAAR